MNLLDMLTGAMTSESSISALSGKTGTSAEQTSSLVSAALPLLMGALTGNASSQDGAQSLLGALSQHTNTGSMAQQLAEADTEDGEKIIGHILGGNSASVIQSLSGQTGVESSQVSSLLSSMAPALLSGLSAAKEEAANAEDSGALDFTSLLGSFGGNTNSAGVGSLLSGLLGGNSEKEESALNGNALLSSLLSFMK